MGAKAPDAGPAVSPGTLNPPGALTRPGRWSKPTQPAWGPQTPGHRPSGLHLTPLPASSRGPARATAEAQPEPRTGQWTWRGRRADSGALTAGREQGGATRRPRPGKQGPGRSSWAPGGGSAPQRGASRKLGRKEAVVAPGHPPATQRGHSSGAQNAFCRPAASGPAPGPAVGVGRGGRVTGPLGPLGPAQASPGPLPPEA